MYISEKMNILIKILSNNSDKHQIKFLVFDTVLPAKVLVKSRKKKLYLKTLKNIFDHKYKTQKIVLRATVLYALQRCIWLVYNGGKEHSRMKLVIIAVLIKLTDGTI